MGLNLVHEDAVGLSVLRHTQQMTPYEVPDWTKIGHDRQGEGTISKHTHTHTQTHTHAHTQTQTHTNTIKPVLAWILVVTTENCTQFVVSQHNVRVL